MSDSDMFASDGDDSEDVVDVTPIKEKSKIKCKKKPKHFVEAETPIDSDDDIVNVTPVNLETETKFDENCEEYVAAESSDLFSSDSDNNVDVINENPLEIEINYVENHVLSEPSNSDSNQNVNIDVNVNPLKEIILEEISADLATYHTPHVFYEVEEILKFSPTYIPANDIFKTVGIVTKCNGTYYLKDPLKISGDSSQLKLNDQSFGVFPKIYDTIEVFAYLIFEGDEIEPTCVVKSWKSVQHDVTRHVQTLKLMKAFVLEEFKRMQTSDDEPSLYEPIRDEDIFLDELDESYLNKNVDEVEELCSDINGLCLISHDFIL